MLHVSLVKHITVSAHTKHSVNLCCWHYEVTLTNTVGYSYRNKWTNQWKEIENREINARANKISCINKSGISNQ